MDSPDPGGTPAASPTAPDASSYLSTLNAEQYQAFRKDGPAFPSDTPAESPAASESQSASTDAKPVEAASEPATPADKPKKNAETRIPELLADRAAERTRAEAAERRANELEARLKALEGRPDGKTDSSPAPTTADKKHYRDHPNAPKVDQYATYEEWVEDFGVFVADQRHTEREQAQQAQTQRQRRLDEVDRIATTARDRFVAARAADPEFDKKFNPKLLDITPAFLVPPGQQVMPWNALIQEVIQSEMQIDLVKHFSTPDGEKEWADLCRLKSPQEMLRRFGRIEARFEKRAESAEATVVPAKTVTSAPAPPTYLGKHPADTADQSKSAVAGGDFVAFKRAEDAKALAARR
jgi:hypothetical protein